jgi:methionyl-tRNA formyltransferase
MTAKEFSIVFMGTPEFATHSLKVLHENGIRIKAVVTAPDKPAGRGQKLRESDVKKYAVSQNLKVLQPTNLKSEAFTQELASLNADLFVVVAFRMLPEVVWDMPPKGTINLHASLLPQFRGAAPINWAIINGEKETGVTTFFIEREIDTGKIIAQSKASIGQNETVGELYDRLMKLGGALLLQTVSNIALDNVSSVSQEDLVTQKLMEAPKIFKGDCQLDFNRPAEQVHNHLRGLDPYPGAWCKLTEKATGISKLFKLFKSEVSEILVKDDKSLQSDGNGLLFPCSDYYIYIKEVQAEGKRRMNFKDFLAGNNIEDYQIVVKNV